MNYFILLFTWLTLVSYTHTSKDLPDGVNYSGDTYQVSDGQDEFLYDLTYIDSAGVYKSNQEIFDSVFTIIDAAEDYILIDMFLFNDWVSSGSEVHRPLTDELTDLLIAKKSKYPDIKIDLITDPINTTYGGGTTQQIQDLELHGINVIVTDLTKLRDSNPIYSSFWRTFLQWFGNSEYGGLFPHPFSDTEGKVTMRSYLNMLNFKANHRKLVLADYSSGYRALIASANPHDGSAAHSNVAIMISGDLANELYKMEYGVARFSDEQLQLKPSKNNFVNQPDSTFLDVQIVSENQIQLKALQMINAAQSGDNINIAMFYFCERDLIKALISAANRGVIIQFILDPNKDAFGYEKNGIPNRQVAHELIKKSENKIEIRWYDTHGEQFHTKMIIANYLDGHSETLLGSANMTRRNIKNFNLETDIYLSGFSSQATFTEMNDYFQLVWSNTDGNAYTVDYEKYRDSSTWKTIIYRIQEAAGLSTF